MPKRYELSTEQWSKIESLVPGKKGDPGRHAVDNLNFVNGVLWIIRSGARWSDLPERNGKYKSVHKRFARWAKNKIWEKIFQTLIADRKNEYLMIDSTIVRAHKQSATFKKNQALGRSRGGLSTKIHCSWVPSSFYCH